MYNEFHIKQFRGVSNLKVEPLARVNLIAGPNGVGKTAFLEAVWMHNAPNVPDTAIRVQGFRSADPIDPNKLLWELFPDLDDSVELELSATGDWGEGKRALKIYLANRETADLPLMSDDDLGELAGVDSESFGSRQEIVYEYTDETGGTTISRGHFVTSRVGQMLQGGFRSNRQPIERQALGIFLAARQRGSKQEEIRKLSNFLESKREGEIVEILQCIDDRIRGLSILTRNNEPAIYVDFGQEHLLPASLMGDGALRLMAIAIAVGDSADGIVMIDEIENGIYFEAMEPVWKAIGEVATKYNVQIFATTHSAECLNAAHRAFSRMPSYDFAFHRLERSGQETHSFTFDQESLETALQTGLETR